MKERLILSVDEREHRFKGLKVSVEAEKSLLNLDVISSRTTKHETDHVLSTDPDNIIDVTVIPGEGYNGRTRLRRRDIPSAAAAFANRRSGTDQDMMIVYLSGHDAGSAVSTAKSRLASNEKYRPAIESMIEEQRTVTGGEIKDRKRKVDEELTLGRKVTLEIKTPDGRTDIREERAKDNIITLEPIDAEEGKEYYSRKAPRAKGPKGRWPPSLSLSLILR